MPSKGYISQMSCLQLYKAIYTRVNPLITTVKERNGH